VVISVAYYLESCIAIIIYLRPQFLPTNVQLVVWTLEHQYLHLIKTYILSEKLEHDTSNVVLVFSITSNVYQWQRFDNCQQAI
jgi:hypothetical protein